LAGCWLHNNAEVEITFRKWLRIQNPIFQGDEIFKLVPRW
jgi:hypothetical protein